MNSVMTTLGSQNLSMMRIESLMKYYRDMLELHNKAIATLTKVLLAVSPTATIEELGLLNEFRKLDWDEKQRLYKLIEAAKHG